MTMEDSSKRKRTDGLDISVPSKRRVVGEALTPEAVRQQIKELYAAYESLIRTAPDGTGGDEEYAVLLNAAANGCSATQRLVARLLPRFANRIPMQTDASATALQHLICLRLSSEGINETTTSSGIHAGSLAGLQQLIHDAAAGGNPSVVEHTLRFALTELASKGVGGGWSVAGDGDERQVQALWQLCRAAFTACPRKAFAQLLEAAASNADSQASIAVEALEKQLGLLGFQHCRCHIM